MELLGCTTFASVIEDWIIYRNLEPVDPRLPGLSTAWREMGLSSPAIPRKHEDRYAAAAAWLLMQARQLTQPGGRIEQFVFLGDTALADVGAFNSLARLSGWPGWCFIGNEHLKVSPANSVQGPVYEANRWEMLADWLHWVQAVGCRCDPTTAVVIDLDKTAIAARGRNSGAIDAARVEGVYRTVAAAMGNQFDQERFLADYGELNRAPYHPFTVDNQDYLAYICLVLNAGLIDRETLIDEVERSQLSNFEQFITWVDRHKAQLPAGMLCELHETVYAGVRAGDPTPFKAFRRNEYRATIERMGCLPDDTPMDERLRSEICLTGEVLDIARWFKSRGALLLSLSDKPDEASLPDPEAAAQDFQPIHRTLTHVVASRTLEL